jgi:hypothetical protein
MNIPAGALRPSEVGSDGREGFENEVAKPFSDVAGEEAEE